MKEKIVFVNWMILFSILIFSCGKKYETYLGKMGIENKKFPYSSFDEVEVFSFNRDTIGNHLKRLKISNLYEKFDENEKWEKGERELVNKLNRELEEVDTSILNSNTFEFAPSNTAVKTLSNKEYEELRNIISNQRDTIFEISSCSPVYRDALIFRKKEKIVGWIDLCFDCSIISFYPESSAYVNSDSWEKLRIYFNQFGNELN